MKAALTSRLMAPMIDRWQVAGGSVEAEVVHVAGDVGGRDQDAAKAELRGLTGGRRGQELAPDLRREAHLRRLPQR